MTTLQRTALSELQAFYEAELLALRLAEDILFEQAMSSPEDEMFNKFIEIWTRREQIMRECEMSITPMPADDLTGNTGISVGIMTCTLEEFLAIPKPGKWKFYGTTFLPPCWIREDVPGRHDSLPESIRKMYKLSPRQIAILEGKIRVEKPKYIPAESQRIQGITEVAHNGASRMEDSYERYFNRMSC